MSDSTVASDTGTRLTCRGCRFCRRFNCVTGGTVEICLLNYDISKNLHYRVTSYCESDTVPNWCPLKGGDTDCQKQHS